MFTAIHPRPFSARPFTAICTLYRFSCPITRIPRLRNSFRMNTCKSVSKQSTLTPLRMNTYEKHKGMRVLLLTTHPMKVQFVHPGGTHEGPVAGNVCPACPACPELFGNPVGERPSEATEGSDLVGRDLSRNPAGDLYQACPPRTSRGVNSAPYFQLSTFNLCSEPFHLHPVAGVLESQWKPRDA